MILRKALGIILFSTQAVVAVDYNMQSQHRGLHPGELSMKDYFAIVQTRYAPQELADATGFDNEGGQQDGWESLTRFSTRIGMTFTEGQQHADSQSDTALREEAVPVCIRRGTALSCQ